MDFLFGLLGVVTKYVFPTCSLNLSFGCLFSLLALLFLRLVEGPSGDKLKSDCYWLQLETLVRWVEGRENEKEQEGKQEKKKNIAKRSRQTARR